MLPPEFAPVALASSRLGIFADRIWWHAEVTSTNDVAAAMAGAGAPEGAVVIADMQTAGRGRHARHWASPPGAGLYASVVLEPPAHATALITIAAGVAIAEGVEAATGLRAALKWPNDLYVGRLKLAGILAESGAVSNGRACVVVGFGVNVAAAAYPPEIAARATSIEVELGRPVDRGLLLAECLAALDRRYGELVERRGKDVIEAWRMRGRPSLGGRVEWNSESGRESGVAADIDETGALLVRTSIGVTRVFAGELRWLS